MGYTHYWQRDKKLNAVSFLAAGEDIKKLIAASGVRVQFESNKPQEPKISDGLIRFNGKDEDGHETFFVSRVLSAEDCKSQEPSKGKYFEFCKTAQKPYDLLVAAALIVLKRHLGDAIKVSSDGEIGEEWLNPKKFAQETLNYGANFCLDS